jgi:uncharacterized membrane protein YphA (DoxX/SURF4 family)
MLKQVVVILLGIFFIINGVNHFYNTDLLKEYAESRGLFSPRFMVRLSGILLLFGGLTLITGYFVVIGAIGLGLFLIAASFSIHTF